MNGSLWGYSSRTLFKHHLLSFLHFFYLFTFFVVLLLNWSLFSLSLNVLFSLLSLTPVFLSLLCLLFLYPFTFLARCCSMLQASVWALRLFPIPVVLTLSLHTVLSVLSLPISLCICTHHSLPLLFLFMHSMGHASSCMPGCLSVELKCGLVRARRGKKKGSLRRPAARHVQLLHSSSLPPSPPFPADHLLEWRRDHNKSRKHHPPREPFLSCYGDCFWILFLEG